jgi:hypothetical protein
MLRSQQGASLMASKPRFASGYDLNNASVLAQIAAGNFGNAKTIFAIFDEAEVRHIFQQYMSGNRGALVLLQTVYPAAVVAQQGNQVYLEESVVETLKRRQVNYRARANVVINGVQVPFVQAGTKVEEWVWVDALHQNDTLDETTCRTLNLDFAPLLSDAMFERYVFLALVAVSGKVDVNNAITVFPIVMALATDFGYQQYRQMMPETTAKLEDLKRRPEGLPTMKVKPGERPNLPWTMAAPQTPNRGSGAGGGLETYDLNWIAQCMGKSFGISTLRTTLAFRYDWEDNVNWSSTLPTIIGDVLREARSAGQLADVLNFLNQNNPALGRRIRGEMPL